MELTKDDRTLHERPPAPSPARRAAPWLVALGLVLTAFNLRPAISALGPVLAEVRDDLGMGGTVAGLLTSVPPLCFAVFGVAAPRLARRFGPAAVVLAGLAAVALGLALRSFAGNTAVFLATTALSLAGIAVGNVLMPVLVLRYFPDRVGSVTGLYSMAFALGAAGAAGLTIPFTEAAGGNWRNGLAVWAATAALALLPWLAVLAPARRRADGAVPAAPRPAREAQAAPPRMIRSRTAWALAGFFGLQATAAYITLGWAPQIFRDAGVSAGTAGLLLAVIMGLGAPLGFVLPRIATRLRHQGPLVLVLGGCGLAGYAGLWLAPAGGAWLWAVLLGIANCAFPVALTMIGMRARTPAGVARLSAFAQSTGYLLCVPGPLLVGTLNDMTGGWHVPLAFMTVLMLAQIAVGMAAGRDRCVEDGD
ncbi:MFS transporter [Streptomyces sp. MP131-18]|uniref:CynX/NimT family MFS transporter n=1 Tax=Streptomyces sp. MP131-18 TaxID=1857892 RepID=UPI0009A1A283|nr:MFS transporter [Streptomyces sp. MP131-18]ONK15289.1 putative transporter YycB [Streptomyces sp. MP131-18]